MVRTWSERRNYRLQWSGAYQRLDQNHQALAVLELAERRALLGEAARLQLIRLYVYLDMPYQARQSVYSSYTRYTRANRANCFRKTYASAVTSVPCAPCP